VVASSIKQFDRLIEYSDIRSDRFGGIVRNRRRPCNVADWNFSPESMHRGYHIRGKHCLDLVVTVLVFQAENGVRLDGGRKAL
jgi:hypothetical protein